MENLTDCKQAKQALKAALQYCDAKQSFLSERNRLSDAMVNDETRKIILGRLWREVDRSESNLFSFVGSLELASELKKVQIS